MTAISGRVIDHSGRPVAGARVMFAAAPGPVPDIALLTDGDGAFSIAAPMPGRYVIAAHHDAGSGEATVNAGTGALDTVEIRIGR